MFSPVFPPLAPIHLPHAWCSRCVAVPDDGAPGDAGAAEETGESGTSLYPELGTAAAAAAAKVQRWDS